jgi:hypothetical protein
MCGLLNELSFDHQDPKGGDVGLDCVGVELTKFH